MCWLIIGSEGKEMTYEEKALIILKSMEKNIQVDWNMEKFYVEPIIAGIKEIERKDKKAQSVDIQELQMMFDRVIETAIKESERK